MSADDEPAAGGGINLARLYDYRFRDVDQQERQAVWSEIARDLYERLGRPKRVLDPAAGRGEFVNALAGVERWIVDTADHGTHASLDPAVRIIIADLFDAPLPADYFDGVLISNFLEHLYSQDQVAAALEVVRRSMTAGGRVAIMGPNFRYCAKEYFDCADHHLALTHVTIAEHLFAAGFEVSVVIPRWLPFSFRSALPASAQLTRRYLAMPLAWKVLGKQFLVLGRKPGVEASSSRPSYDPR